MAGRLHRRVGRARSDAGLTGSFAVAWIEVHQAVWTHRKTAALAERLGVPETYAAAHLIRFWTWALDNAPDGILRCSPRVIARAADWEGDHECFVAALHDLGWLDIGSEHYAIHDWGEFAGRLIERREQDKERKRRTRGEARSISSAVRRTSGGQDADVLRTVPNRTQPDRTGPDQDTNTAADAAVRASDTEPAEKYSDAVREEYQQAEGPKAKPVESGQVAVIFGEYQVRIQPKAKLTDDARRKIRARLRAWTIAELREAIAHFAADAWHMENNAHRGAAWFFDRDSRIEQYMNMTPRASLPKNGAPKNGYANLAPDRFSPGISLAEAEP